MMITGYDLKHMREVARLTQKEVAKELGVTPWAIGKLERKGTEKIRINPDHWPKLARLLNKPVDIFYNEYPTKHTVTASGGSIAQSAGKDAVAPIGEKLGASPLDTQLFSLVVELWPEKRKKEEINKLLKIRQELQG